MHGELHIYIRPALFTLLVMEHTGKCAGRYSMAPISRGRLQGFVLSEPDLNSDLRPDKSTVVHQLLK